MLDLSDIQMWGNHQQSTNWWERRRFGCFLNILVLYLRFIGDGERDSREDETFSVLVFGRWFVCFGLVGKNETSDFVGFKSFSKVLGWCFPTLWPTKPPWLAAGCFQSTSWGIGEVRDLWSVRESNDTFWKHSWARRDKRVMWCFWKEFARRYGIVLPEPDKDRINNDPNRAPTVDELFSAYAFVRGFMGQSGAPNMARAGEERKSVEKQSNPKEKLVWFWKTMSMVCCAT